MDFTGINYEIPVDYEYRSTENNNVIFCPNCGAVNHINPNWYGSIQSLIFCVICGKEIQ